MSNEESLKQLVRDYVEVVWNARRLGAMELYMASGFTDHTASPGMPPGLESIRQLLAMQHKAFPDSHATIQLQVAEGDFVVSRLIQAGTHRGAWFGIPPTGRSVSVTSTSIVRVRDGKLCEQWSNRDDLGLMQQIGAIQFLGS